MSDEVVSVTELCWECTQHPYQEYNSDNCTKCAERRWTVHRTMLGMYTTIL